MLPGRYSGVCRAALTSKAKTIYPEGVAFGWAKIQMMRIFERLFHLTVDFACLDPGGGPQAYWVRLDQLDDMPAVHRGGGLTLTIPLPKPLP